MAWKHTYINIILALLCAFAGCKNGSDDWSPIPITRLDSLAFVYNDRGEVAMPENCKACVNALLQYMEPMHGDSTWQAYATSRAVEAFAPEALSIFPDLTSLRDTLGMMLHNAAANGLVLPRRHYATVVWSDRKSIVINEPYVFIGLNHYLGSEHPAYSGWPEYVRATKTPKMLPYDLAEALIANAYPYDSIAAKQRTILSRLLYEGALAYAKMQVVPDASEALVLNYNEPTLVDIQSNEVLIWKHLIEGKMLYSTDAALMDKLFAPAPHTYLISPEAPGRVARFIGLEIVKNYLTKYPQTTLNQLLSPGFFGAINTLEKAGYSPI